MRQQLKPIFIFPIISLEILSTWTAVNKSNTADTEAPFFGFVFI